MLTHSGHTVLSSTSLCNDTLLGHTLAEQGLTQAVVDLVGASVVQILTLQVDAWVATIGPTRVLETRKCRRQEQARPDLLSGREKCA